MSQNSVVSSSVSPNQLLVVLTSLPNMDAAKSMARALVDEKMAACVQLMDGMQSVYRWDGKVCEENEVQLSAKTTASKWSEILRFIQERHPYDLPEILAFSPEQYDEQYGRWIQAEVNLKA
jgi:periplasmic divalent cation tolerance protein